MKILKKNKKVLVIVGLVVILGGWLGLRTFSTDASSPVSTDINYQTVLNANNANGNPLEQTVEFSMLSASKQADVLVKGKRAYARNNKAFLIIDIAVKNDSNSVVYFNAEDIVRWVESEDTFIAPQVNQGNLEIRPQATKKSNVGFVVPENEKSFTVQIGSLNGEKELVEISF